MAHCLFDLNGSSGCRYSNAAEQTHSWARMARFPMALWISFVSAIGSTRLTAKIFKQSTAAVLLTLFISRCVPTTTDTVTLSQAALAPAQSGRISSDGYRLEAVPNSGHAPDLLVLVAMSGGGKRSAA